MSDKTTTQIGVDICNNYYILFITNISFFIINHPKDFHCEQGTVNYR